MKGIHRTREEIARLELGHTDVQPVVARALLAFFLATIVLPVAVQTFAALTKRESVTAGAGASRENTSGATQVGNRLRQIQSVGDLLAFVPTARQLREFEDRLADRSVVARSLTPWVGWLIKGWLHGGDEQVYFGRGGWLFYRPSVDAVAGPDFLDQEWYSRRLHDADPSLPPPQPDPLKALIEFHRQLAERGITLIVMPVPGKESIYPEMLAPRLAGNEPVQNPSFKEFKFRLSAAGILVFDPAPILTGLKQETRAYLKADTHWSPVAMERVASDLAATINQRKLLPPTADFSSTYQTATVRNTGDITTLLALPASQEFFPPETVSIGRVLADDGRPWKPDERADVLLLGDSFSNIYSLAAMGWGDSAGLAEHLSAALGRAVDRLAINAGGASAGRRELARELAAGRDRLTGKRVVIYEFASRELSNGDWKRIDLPQNVPSVDPARAAEGSLVIDGRIAAIGRLPRPGSVPYKDCLLSIHLTDIQGLPAGNDEHEVLVYVMGMKDNKWLAVSSLRPGDELRCRVRAWSEVETQYGTYNRAELDNLDVLSLPTFWIEKVMP